MSEEINALDELVCLGRGSIEICLTENGRVGIFWTGREGCGITGDSAKDCLGGRYFRNELYRAKEPA